MWFLWMIFPVLGLALLIDWKRKNKIHPMHHIDSKRDESSNYTMGDNRYTHGE